MTTVIEMPLAGSQTTDPSAWQELGHKADTRPFREQAADLGLNWKIEERKVFVDFEGEMGRNKEQTPAWKALVRNDTGDVFNIPKKRYVPVQPEHILAFFDSLRETEHLEMDTVGVLGGGRVIWGLAKTGRELGFSEHDRVKEYVLAASSADYSFSTVVKRTAIRVICQNTLEMAIAAGDEGQGFIKRSHAGTFDFELARKKIQAIKADEGTVKEFQADMEKLARHKVSEDEAVKFFVKTMFPGKKVQEVQDSKRSSGRLEEILNAYRTAPGQELETAQGTAWGLLNAVTYLADHTLGKTADSRLRSSFFAEGATLKQNALKVALKLTA